MCCVIQKYNIIAEDVCSWTTIIIYTIITIIKKQNSIQCGTVEDLWGVERKDHPSSWSSNPIAIITVISSLYLPSYISLINIPIHTSPRHRYRQIHPLYCTWETLNGR